MEIIINGRKTIVNPMLKDASYSELCHMADVPEKRQPTVVLSLPDGRSVSLARGECFDLEPGTIVNVAVTGGA